MKNEHLNTTLSCILKCIRFSLVVINKKIIFGLFILCFLGACASPTAMLGPTFTFTSTGSALQTGFSYGSGKIIEKYTGKTPIENLQELTLKENKQDKQENNIQKQTLESEEFLQLVKNKIQKTKEIIVSSNQ
jgi:hypothetical protein